MASPPACTCGRSARYDVDCVGCVGVERCSTCAFGRCVTGARMYLRCVWRTGEARAGCGFEGAECCKRAPGSATCVDDQAQETGGPRGTGSHQDCVSCTRQARTQAGTHHRCCPHAHTSCRTQSVHARSRSTRYATQVEGIRQARREALEAQSSDAPRRRKRGKKRGSGGSSMSASDAEGGGDGAGAGTSQQPRSTAAPATADGRPPRP